MNIYELLEELDNVDIKETKRAITKLISMPYEWIEKYKGQYHSSNSRYLNSRDYYDEISKFKDIDTILPNIFLPSDKYGLLEYFYRNNYNVYKYAMELKFWTLAVKYNPEHYAHKCESNDNDCRQESCHFQREECSYKEDYLVFYREFYPEGEYYLKSLYSNQIYSNPYREEMYLFQRMSNAMESIMERIRNEHFTSSELTIKLKKILISTKYSRESLQQVFYMELIDNPQGLVEYLLNQRIYFDDYRMFMESQLERIKNSDIYGISSFILLLEKGYFDNSIDHQSSNNNGNHNDKKEEMEINFNLLSFFLPQIQSSCKLLDRLCRERKEFKSTSTSSIINLRDKFYTREEELLNSLESLINKLQNCQGGRTSLFLIFSEFLSRQNLSKMMKREGGEDCSCPSEWDLKWNKLKSKISILTRENTIKNMELFENITEDLHNLHCKIKRSLSFKRIVNLNSIYEPSDFPSLIPGGHYIENGKICYRGPITFDENFKNNEIIEILTNSKSRPKKVSFDHGKFLLKRNLKFTSMNDVLIVQFFQLTNLYLRQDLLTCTFITSTDQGDFEMIEWLQDYKSCLELLKIELQKENQKCQHGKNVKSRDRKEIVETECEFESEIDFEYDSITPSKLTISVRKFIEHDDPVIHYQRVRMMIQSYAAHCIAGYIIGLGDRHLENILINQDGKWAMVDYELCLDEGNRLAIPELIPFRLSKGFQDLVYLDQCSLFRDTMEKVLQVYRDNIQIFQKILESLYKGRKDERSCQEIIDKIMGIENHDSHKDCHNLESPSIRDHVTRLIQTATDQALLNRMYRGWMPWV